MRSQKGMWFTNHGTTATTTNGNSESILGFGLKQINGSPKTVFVVDTNVLVNDARALDNLQDNGTNAVVVPWMVLNELDSLKIKPDLSRSVSDVVRVINRKLREKDSNFYIAQGSMGDYPDLDQNNPDHHIIAVCLSITKQYPSLNLVLVSNDAMVHTVGSSLGLTVEEYQEDQVSRIDFESPLPVFSANDFQINEQLGNFSALAGKELPIPHNSGAILTGDDTAFPVIRKNDLLIPIPADLNALGIAPFSMDAEFNYAQYVALYQLLDPSISLMTIHGEAGTGKTLLSIAAALKQLKIEEASGKPAAGKTIEDNLKKLSSLGSYRKVYIARPFIHLGNVDRMGFLPGDIEAKSTPWLAPVNDNIDLIVSLNGSNLGRIKKINEARSLEIMPLSFIRGRTLVGAFVIIDEAQNLTRTEVKTIVTRCGEGTKIVLVGDINQIDIRWIDKLSSGLTHVTVKMGHLPYFANTFLDKSVRSQTAKDAANLL
jgi:PhoH-like ATPase